MSKYFSQSPPQIAKTLVLTGFVALSVSVSASPSFAAAFSYTSTVSTKNITDNNATGISQDLIISDASTINNLTVTINGLTHTWAGDLIATFTKVSSGTTVNLFNRVGRAGSGVGDSSNLNGNYSFNISGSDLWAAASLVNTFTNIAAGTYFASTSKSSGATNVAVASSPTLSAFYNQSLSGTWRLTISDPSSIATGSFQSFTVSGDATTSAVPEPLTILGAMTAAGFGAVFKRRSAKSLNKDNSKD